MKQGWLKYVEVGSEHWSYNSTSVLTHSAEFLYGELVSPSEQRRIGVEMLSIQRCQVVGV